VLEGEDAYRGPWATYEGERIGELSGPTEEEREKYEKDLQAAEEAAEQEKEKRGKATPAKPIPTGSEKTIFHGKEEHDYMGRTYMHVPQDLDVNLLGEPGTKECFVPKKLLHTWTGHTKGVSAIRFIPRSAHLLLSGSMDSKVKVRMTPGSQIEFTPFFSSSYRLPALTLHLIALGCISRPPRASHILGPLQSCPRCNIQQRWHTILECILRPEHEALGYRNWKMHLHLHDQEDPLRRQIQPG
jgi:hypothetical protein